MRRVNSSRPIFLIAGCTVVLVQFCALAVQAQSASSRKAGITSEQKTARYFESIRKSPPQMLAFLLKMPKGGDLHSHLSGAVYAESYVQWAAAKGLCVNQATMALSQPPCDEAA